MWILSVFLSWSAQHFLSYLNTCNLLSFRALWKCQICWPTRLLGENHIADNNQECKYDEIVKVSKEYLQTEAEDESRPRHLCISWDIFQSLKYGKFQKR